MWQRNAVGTSAAGRYTPNHATSAYPAHAARHRTIPDSRAKLMRGHRLKAANSAQVSQRIGLGEASQQVSYCCVSNSGGFAVAARWEPPRAGASVAWPATRRAGWFRKDALRKFPNRSSGRWAVRVQVGMGGARKQASGARKRTKTDNFLVTVGL
jgi:hypothetical protein